MDAVTRLLGGAQAQKAARDLVEDMENQVDAIVKAYNVLCGAAPGNEC